MDGWLEILSIAWVVPLVLESMMAVATAIYDFFVAGGIIYMLIWGWLAFSIGLYLIKMYFPKQWVEMFALHGGGQMYDPKTDGWSVSKDVAKPMLRALFAIIILLQVKPNYITHYVVDPFLEFGAVYVSAVTKTILPNQQPAKTECPKDLGEYLSKDGCLFLVNPIHEVSAVNARIIKQGLGFVARGFAGPFPAGIMNIITGLFLIFAFFSCNFFMTLLIVQGIFKFGMALIKYPFSVLVYVVKTPEKNDDHLWVNPWPAFADVVKSLQKLIVAMIAVAFILLINVSVAFAMFNFSVDRVDGFGGHSVAWMTAILTFLIMYQVFDMTRKQLNDYVDDKDMTGFYDKVATETKGLANDVVSWGKNAIRIAATGKASAAPAAPAAPTSGGAP